MGKCCKNLKCSVSGETYEINDATARAEIEALKNTVAELQQNGGGASGPAMAVKTFVNDDCVYIHKSDLPGIVEGSPVILSIHDGEPSYGPPGCSYRVGAYDLNYEQDMTVPVGGTITFDTQHKIIYAYYENGLFHVPMIYNKQYDYRAKVASGDSFTLGISPADISNNSVTVTYWKE